MQKYSEYLDTWKTNNLKFEEALEIYEGMINGINKCKALDKDEFVSELIKKAIKYTEIRVNWEIMSREEKIDKDSLRTGYHDSFITSINIISRLLDLEGIDISWRDKLGDDRKRIGDFACFMSYMIGITNR